jgi:hypothetical protein
VRAGEIPRKKSVNVALERSFRWKPGGGRYPLPAPATILFDVSIEGFHPNLGINPGRFQPL